MSLLCLALVYGLHFLKYSRGTFFYGTTHILTLLFNRVGPGLIQRVEPGLPEC